MASRENFNVFLRSDIAVEARELFSSFVKRITLKNGTALFYLECSEVSAANPIYLEVVVNPPNSDVPWPFQIPHYMILAINGPVDQANPIGFLTNDA